MLEYDHMRNNTLYLTEKGSDTVSKWSEIVNKISKLNYECKNNHKKSNFNERNNLDYIGNLTSFQDTKNLCSLSGEIMRRNGMPYVILDFLKKMLYLRGYYCLTKENVLMQLSKYSIYMHMVEVSE
ncbi:hypothetical protein RS030_101620 [Cryptosporidium xiaoi]|uniref:Uncharacterized protein n=1 Tax=Cryptosporidium xiaoi TaxID=659607 RepID=A0AAV9Y316_9CRYT